MSALAGPKTSDLLGSSMPTAGKTTRLSRKVAAMAAAARAASRARNPGQQDDQPDRGQPDDHDSVLPEQADAEHLQAYRHEQPPHPAVTAPLRQAAQREKVSQGRHQQVGADREGHVLPDERHEGALRRQRRDHHGGDRGPPARHAEAAEGVDRVSQGRRHRHGLREGQRREVTGGAQADQHERVIQDRGVVDPRPGRHVQHEVDRVGVHQPRVERRPPEQEDHLAGQVCRQRQPPRWRHPGQQPACPAPDRADPPAAGRAGRSRLPRGRRAGLDRRGCLVDAHRTLSSPGLSGLASTFAQVNNENRPEDDVSVRAARNLAPPIMAAIGLT